MTKGFAHFNECLNSYLNMLDITSTEINNCQIKIFGSVTLNNGAILRAINKYHNRPWFSNVAVFMDNEEIFEYQSDSGTCYAQVYVDYNITLKMIILNKI
jgi:hypothetical protein